MIPKKNRTSWTILGWFVAVGLLIWALFGIDLAINMFTWVPKWNFEVVGCLLGVGALLVFFFLLARLTTGELAIIGGFLACLMALFVGVSAISPEPLGAPGTWFARTQSSPAWYRGARVAVVSVPAVLWGWAYWRSKRRSGASRADE